jgi:acid phosphatase (class A)
MGGSINAANFPAVLKVLQGSMHDMRIMEFTIKYKHLRPRPYHLEASLQPMARMSSPSYTSGHTMWAFLQAFIWSEIVPEKENAFIALAEEIRRSREIMGIHYPATTRAHDKLLTKCSKLFSRISNSTRTLPGQKMSGSSIQKNTSNEPAAYNTQETIQTQN